MHVNCGRASVLVALLAALVVAVVTFLSTSTVAYASSVSTTIAVDVSCARECTWNASADATVTLTAASSGQPLAGQEMRVYFTYAKPDGSPGNWQLWHRRSTDALGRFAFNTPPAIKRTFIKVVYAGDIVMFAPTTLVVEILAPRPPASPVATNLWWPGGSREVEYGARNVNMVAVGLRTGASWTGDRVPLEPVELEGSVITSGVAGPWSVVATGVTADHPDNWPQILVAGPITQPMMLRANYGGSAFFMPSRSTTDWVFRIVPAQTAVSVTSNRTSVDRYGAVTLNGRITRATPGLGLGSGTHITVYAKRPGSSNWVRLSTRHTAGGNKWSYTYHSSTRGAWQFRAKFGGLAFYRASTSSIRRIVVR